MRCVHVHMTTSTTMAMMMMIMVISSKIICKSNRRANGEATREMKLMSHEIVDGLTSFGKLTNKFHCEITRCSSSVFRAISLLRICVTIFKNAVLDAASRANSEVIHFERLNHHYFISSIWIKQNLFRTQAHRKRMPDCQEMISIELKHKIYSQLAIYSIEKSRKIWGQQQLIQFNCLYFQSDGLGQLRWAAMHCKSDFFGWQPTIECTISLLHAMCSEHRHRTIWHALSPDAVADLRISSEHKDDKCPLKTDYSVA